MFKLKVSKVKDFVNYVNAIAVLVDEPRFKVEQDCVKVRELDPSRVAMIDFVLPKSFFAEYEIDKNTKMCVMITAFLKLLKRAGEGEEITLFFDDYSQKVEVKITGKHDRSFTLPTLEVSDEEVPTPTVTFNVKAKVTAAILSQAVEDACITSDHVRVEADSEKIVLKAAGDLTGATITLTKENDTLLDLQAPKELEKATYSLSYLGEMMKAASATSKIAFFEFTTDFPVKIDFQQETEAAKLTFFLAPRIEAE